MLHVVDERVLERRVEQRREVTDPHRGREQEPGDDGEREEAQDAGMEHRQDPPLPGRWRRDTQHQRHGCGQRDQRCGNQRQQDVLDHVDREQSRVVLVDPGQEGEGDREHAAGEGHASAAWHGVRRVQCIDPPDRPGPPREGDQDGQGRQRLERPAEEEVLEGRRLGRGRAMGGGR